MKRRVIVIGAVSAMLLCVALSPSASADELQTEESVAELGGKSGEYTSWERIGIDGFHSLHTVATISRVDGKRNDQWDSIARIVLDDDTDGKDDTTTFSLILQVDRRTKEITPRIQLGRQQPWKQLPGQFEMNQRIDVKFTRNTDATMLLQIADETFQLPLDFPVTKVKLLGSGVDVAFEPIVLTRQ